MKLAIGVGILALTGVAAGCATAEPAVISAQQINAFRDAVRKAEASGAADGPSEAANMLREAKSDFYYAQHLPADPTRARHVAAQAQAEAERALSLASADAGHRLALRSAGDPTGPDAAPAVIAVDKAVPAGDQTVTPTAGR